MITIGTTPSLGKYAPMNLAPLFFIFCALVLLGLLAYAVRAIEKGVLSPDSVFEALSEPLHSFRLPRFCNRFSHLTRFRLPAF
jgi:hypothetical protein